MQQNLKSYTYNHELLHFNPFSCMCNEWLIHIHSLGFTQQSSGCHLRPRTKSGIISSKTDGSDFIASTRKWGLFDCVCALVSLTAVIFKHQLIKTLQWVLADFMGAVVRGKYLFSYITKEFVGLILPFCHTVFISLIWSKVRIWNEKLR